MGVMRHSIYIWITGIREAQIILRDNSSAATSLLLNNITYELFSGMNGGKISLWDTYRKKIKNDFIGHSTLITFMSIYKINNDTILLSVGADDGKIKLWDLKNKNECINIKRHFSEINCLDFSPDFNYFASASQDGIIKIWDLRNQNKCLKEIDNKICVNCFRFNPFKSTFAFGTKDKYVKYYNLKTFELICQSKIERSAIEKIEFDNNGNGLFSASNDCLKYYNIGDDYFFNEGMFETQWKKLCDFQYIQNRSICAISSNGSKLNYYFMKYKDMFGGKNKNIDKMPNIKEDLLESEDSNLINESNINNNLELNPLSIKNKGKNIQSGKSKKSNNDKNFEEYQNSNPVLDDFNSNENLGKSKINNTNINDNESVNSSDFIDLSSLAKGGKYYFFY